MNKAFVREADNTDDDGDVQDQLALPPSTKNYMTQAGYDALRFEFMQLLDDERPKLVELVHWAASNGDRSENGDYLYGKRRLREIDRRLRFLTKRLEIAEVVNPSVHYGGDQVFFGATVTYLEDGVTERTVCIRGIDEANSARQEVSWVSPIARVLLKSKVGDELNLQTPAGLVQIEVLSVSYPKP